LLARAAIGLGEKALALQHIVFIADMATAEPYTNSNMNVALWSLVAELHYMLDDVAEAITHYKKWITMVDKHITDYFIRADAYSIMASFFLSLKDYPQALVYSKLCYEYRERVYLTEQAVLETAKRNAYCNHAIILSLSKKGMEAINFWNKAMVLAKGPLDEARVLEKAAKCFTAAGDYNNAVSFYARCFEAYLAYEKQTHKRLPTSDLTAYLTAYSQYVVILFEEMEDLKKAEMACIRCVELLEKHYGSESLDTASGYYMLGMVLLKSGWQANGKKALDKAEHILRSSNDPMHRDMVKNCQLCK
jgi:tetratricopeptide (TPR) repeat protein